MPSNEEVKKFLEPENIPRLPPEGLGGHVDMITRVTTLALAAGASSYTVLPEVFNISRVGLEDEKIAVLAAAGTGFFASIRTLRKLCEKSDDASMERVKNLVRGAGGGVGLGLTGISAASAKLALSTLVDGGIVAMCTLAGCGWGAYQNHRAAGKLCPHCHEKGNCNDRFCGKCNAIFYPLLNPIDCSNNYFLSWYQIASHLHGNGFKYNNSVALLRMEVQNWEIYKTEGSFEVDCESYKKWFSENKELVANYKRLDATRN